MALHGRAAELTVLQRAVRAAVGGAPRAVVLVGEPGIGKSALLRAAGAAAEEARLLTLAGRAIEQERDLPWALVAALLDEHAAAVRPPTLAAAGTELAAVLPSVVPPERSDPPRTEDRFRYHRALRLLLDDLAGERPFALLLDDLQWADDASLEWVLHLLRRPPRAPAALLLATRPGPPALDLIDAAREHGEDLWLGPLDDDAALALLEGAVDPAVAPRLVREAGGNPLFLRELARAAPGAERPPATILAAVQREAAALPRPARELLAGAAVVEEPFDAPLAAAAAGLTGEVADPALDVLVGAGVVRPDGDRPVFRFRHPLVARAVYEAMPPAARLAAHRRAAAELARRHAPPALRAHHVERSATPGDDDAVALLALAAEQVVETAPATAARWWGTALGLLRHHAGEERARLLEARAHALAAAGRPEEALAGFDALEQLGRAAAARAAAPAARVERLLGRVAAARARLERALEAAPEGARAELELELAAVAFTAEDVAATLAHARRAVAAQPGDDAAARAIVRAVEGFAAVWSGATGTGALADAERLTLAVPERDALEVAQWAGAVAFQCERFAQAARLLIRAGAARTGRRADHLLPQLRTTLALALFFDLRPVEALEHAEAAEDGARLQGVPMQVGFAAGARALILDLLGRPGEAEQAARDSLALVLRSEASLITRTAAAFDHAMLHAHDPERLLRELVALLGPELDGVERATSLLRIVVGAALAAGRDADAERWVARAEGLVGRVPLLAGRVRTALARAELLLARGDARTAFDHAAAAVEHAEAASLAYDAARAQIVLGRAAAATGDRDRARAALDRALADATRAGAESLAAEARRELRAIGGRASAAALRAASAGDAVLSQRERMIAELVARGRSNKEVAATLFLSAKTVENNLSRIYAKLGVRTRTELARALPRE